MHDSAGYSFHGDAPITGLTPHEVNALMLGHKVHNRQQEAAASNESPAVHERRREIQQNNQRHHEQKVRERGFH